MTFVLSLVSYFVSLFLVTIVLVAAMMWAFPAPTASHRAATEVSAQNHSNPRQTVRTLTRRLAEQVVAQR